MALTAASFTRTNDQATSPKRRSPRLAFNLYNRIVNGRGAPATQFRRRAGFGQKLYAIGNLLSADLFRAYTLRDALDDMTPELREQITMRPNDYLRKCLAFRLAEYCQVLEQYEIEDPLGTAIAHGEAELKRNAESCRELAADALAIWHEVAGTAGTWAA